MSLLKLIRSDLAAGPKGAKALISTCLLNQAFKATFWYRIAHWLAGHRLRFLAHIVTYTVKARFGIELSPLAEIGRSFRLRHGFGTVIGEGAKIGAHCVMYHQVTLGQGDPVAGRAEYPVLGDRVTVYAGAKLIGRIKVGDGAVVGANAVVVRDVPPNVIVGGIPAKPIGLRETGEDRAIA